MKKLIVLISAMSLALGVFAMSKAPSGDACGSCPSKMAKQSCQTACEDKGSCKMEKGSDCCTKDGSCKEAGSCGMKKNGSCEMKEAAECSTESACEMKKDAACCTADGSCKVDGECGMKEAVEKADCEGGTCPLTK